MKGLRVELEAEFDCSSLSACLGCFLLDQYVWQCMCLLCSDVLCSAAEAHLRQLDREVDGSSFLAGSVFVESYHRLLY